MATAWQSGCKLGRTFGRLLLFWEWQRGGQDFHKHLRQWYVAHADPPRDGRATLEGYAMLSAVQFGGPDVCRLTKGCGTPT